MACEVLDMYLRQYKKSCVIGNEVNIILASFMIPADKRIPVGRFPGSRTKKEAGDITT
jgi:hypothetical protein